jgi:small neutral amino acid transporter SnatA (MarC family)
MARFEIRGGSTIESMTSAELWDLLDKRERERARGLKWVEFAIPLNAGPANVLTVGPEQGFSWAVRVISSTLGSAGTLTAYKSSSTAQTSRLVGYNSTSQTAQVMQFPSDTLFLQHGSAVYLVASTTLTNYYIAGWEVIAEQQWKVAD